MVRDGGISPLPSAGITAPSRRLCAETGCAKKQTQFLPQLAQAPHNPSGRPYAGGIEVDHGSAPAKSEELGLRDPRLTEKQREANTWGKTT